jgi:hypothetical protein
MRCNCAPFCPRCGDGACDCYCTEEQVKEYRAEEEKRIAKVKAADAALLEKVKALGLTDDEIYRLRWL